MNYIIHNLIRIEIDDSLLATFGKSLDFQIGYFKNIKENSNDDISSIKIFPFSQFNSVLKSYPDISEFHLSKGVKGNCFFNLDKRLASVKTRDGYEIYADGPNFLINLYIQLLIYNLGYCMIHAGGYANKNGVTLVTGPGGVGKTALLGYMVNKYDCKILGDDIVIIRNDGQCFSYPRAFVFKEYHREVYPELFKELKVARFSTYPFKRFLIDNIPFTGLLKKGLKRIGKYHTVAEGIGLDSCLATVPVKKIFGANSVLDQGAVSKVVFVERYNGSDFSCSTLEAVSMKNRMFSIIHHEWSSVLVELFELGSLEVINLPDYFNKVEKNITELLHGCELKMLRIPNGASPKDLIAAYDKYGLI